MASGPFPFGSWNSLPPSREHSALCSLELPEALDQKLPP